MTLGGGLTLSELVLPPGRQVYMEGLRHAVGVQWMLSLFLLTSMGMLVVSCLVPA